MLVGTYAWGIIISDSYRKNPYFSFSIKITIVLSFMYLGVP
jgi:hypothetical protein